MSDLEIHPRQMPQQPHPGSILEINFAICLVLLIVYAFGFYAATRQWPKEKKWPDFLVKLPVGIFGEWLLISRLGVRAERLSDADFFMSAILGVGLMMILGMSIYFVNMKPMLSGIGTEILSRLQRALTELLGPSKK